MINNEALEKLISLARTFNNVCLLTSNEFPGSSNEIIAGFGNTRSICAGGDKNSFEALKKEIAANPGWWFGHFSYDLKNELEALLSEHPDGIGFPLLKFVIPEFIAEVRDQKLNLTSTNGKNVKEFFEKIPESFLSSPLPVLVKQRTGKQEYLHAVKKLKEHISAGNIYEINYCIEFFAEDASIDPVSLFLKLNALNEAPFSALYRDGSRWLICASPERFLKKQGNRLISQPIKGTRPRGKTTEEDTALVNELAHNEKEKSENVMIVDLVRNDLSRSAKKESVIVTELFGIYSFKNVHQMISTVEAELADDVHPVDALKNAFPMGSMTGAPKIRAMELAEEFEDMKRGLYSGAIGYFTPGMDFDFNVVIRSIQYNAETGYLSFMVGSAITANSDPEKEYAECLVKAKTLFEALGLEPKE